MPESEPGPSVQRLALRLSLAYLALGLAWIAATSLLAATVLRDVPTLAGVELLKGGFFVAATAALLYLMVRHWGRQFAQQQRALADKELWLQLAVEGSGGAGWTAEMDPANPDPWLSRLYLSPELKALLGFRDDELANRLEAWLGQMPPEDAEDLMNAVRGCLEGHRDSFDVSFRIRHKDGSQRWLRSRARLQRDAEGRPLRWAGIDWDITAEQRQREELQLAAKVFESGTEGVMIMDAQERIVALNAAYTHITGYKLDDVRGLNPVQFLTSARNLDQSIDIRRAVLEKGAWHGEYQGHRRDGSAYAARLSVSVILGADGRPSNFIVILSDVTELHDSRAQLDLMRNRDPLTGLANEAAFTECVAAEIVADAAADSRVLAILDLARFQAINDSLGERAGDQLLIELGARLKELKGVSALGRFVGDRFGLLWKGPADLQQALVRGEQLLAEIGRSFSVMGHAVHLSACIGLALHPQHAATAAELLRRATSALSEARRKGPGTVLVYHAEMSERSLERIRMEAALRRAIKRNELQCYFQPRVSLASGRWLGAEALIRWPRAPGFGGDGHEDMVPPERFLAVAQDAGLLPGIDAWMLRTALAHAADWRRRGLIGDDFRISVNVAATQVGSELVAQVRKLLERSALPPSILELELTEQLIMSAPERSAQILRQLRALGVRVAVDDFGTGYSSLSYLHRLPLDSLKVDRSFVSELPDQAEAMAIVRSIVALGRSLRLRLVAEGVETQRQCDTMRKLGCDEAQGFLFAPGLAAREFERALKSGWTDRDTMIV